MSERRQDRQPAKAEPDTEIRAAGTEEAQFSIGELADELGISTRAIRFYETKGLISPARKGVARAYTRRDRARLMLILRGKNLGFSLRDIHQYLQLYDTDPTQQAQLKLLKSLVDAHIAKLKRKRADLDRALKELAGIKDSVDTELAQRDAPARGEA